MSLAGHLWALPSFVLAYFSPGLASPVSYLITGILGLYYFLETERGKVLLPFLVLGLSYYLIAGFNYPEISVMDYFLMVLKYLIVIIAGATLLRKTTLIELYVFLLIGAATIVIHALFFPFYNAGFSPTYGRFSGFYLNPNYAGAISLIGFALSFGVKDKKLKYFGQLVFTIGGFFTFSRYFLGMWILLNFLSVYLNRKNLIVPAIGAVCILVIFSLSSGLSLNKERLNAFESIFSANGADTEALSKDSRTETWANYKDIILDKPIWGNGFKKLQGMHYGLNAGVHNTYLLVIGEAGIFPFSILVGIYVFFLVRGYRLSKTEPHHALLAIVLFTALLVTHNYFDKFSLLLMSMYMYLTLTEGTYLENANKEHAKINIKF